MLVEAGEHDLGVAAAQLPAKRAQESLLHHVILRRLVGRAELVVDAADRGREERVQLLLEERRLLPVRHPS